MVSMTFVARAEEPAPAAGAEADGAPDIVRLKNGGLLRGKISELIPGDSVTIVTLAGKTREIAMNEVDYAGPSAEDPQLAAPPAPAPAAVPKASEDLGSEREASSGNGEKARPYITVHGKEARLHIVSNEEGITFHRQASSAVAVGAGGSAFATGYERICTAPCDVSLPAGTETLALSREGKRPIAAEPVTLPPGKSELRGSFESRSGVRTAGWVLMFGGGIAGAVLMFTATSSEKDCSIGADYCLDKTTLNVSQLIGGGVLMGVGIGAGVLMVRVPDKAMVEVAGSGAGFSRPLAVARGVTFSGTF